MKYIVFVLMFLPVLAFTQNKNYTLTGNIEGGSDGTKVYLKSEGTIKVPVNDSATLKNGRFIFSGSLEAPVLVKLIIDRTPKGGHSGEATWAASNFYLENSNITYSGNVNTLPSFYYKRNAQSTPPVIKGSKAQEESVKFSEGIAPVKKALAETDAEYLKVYHVPAMEGKFNTKEGIALAHQYNTLSEQVLQYTMEYIHAHPESIIAFDQSFYMLAGYTTTLTIPQIEDLLITIGAAWKGTYNMEAFKETSVHARKTAIGIPYQDFEFSDPECKKVMLSQFVPKGKVVMLEFWASWCGPCRAEITHLKHLNETKADQFSIVSISLDENLASWKKAMKEEGMIWTQLVDDKGFEGEIAQAYNIFGIPHSLVLDEEGRIMKVGLRGAFIDAYIEEMAAKKK